MISYIAYYIVKTAVNPKAGVMLLGIIAAIGGGLYLFKYTMNSYEEQQYKNVCLDTNGKITPCTKSCTIITPATPFFLKEKPDLIKNWEPNQHAWVCRGWSFYFEELKDLAHFMDIPNLGSSHSKTIGTVGILTLLISLLGAFGKGPTGILKSFVTASVCSASLIYVPEIIEAFSLAIGDSLSISFDDYTRVQRYVDAKQLMYTCTTLTFDLAKSWIGILTGSISGLVNAFLFFITLIIDILLSVLNLIFMCLQTVYILLIPFLFLFETFKGDLSTTKIFKYIGTAILIFLVGAAQNFIVPTIAEASGQGYCTLNSWGTFSNAVVHLIITILMVAALVIPILISFLGLIFRVMMGTSMVSK